MTFPMAAKKEPAYAPPTLLSANDLQDDSARQNRRKRRFLYFTALSLLTLLFFTGHLSISFMIRVPPDHPSEPHPFPIPPDVELHDCIEWTEGKGDFLHFIHGNLTVDSASDLLFLSRGSLSSGYFDLAQSKEHNDGKVGIKIFATWNKPNLSELTKVCRISRGESQGVGIFSPDCNGRRRSRRNEPKFIVHVELPAGKKGPLAVKSLEGDLPLFEQAIQGLDKDTYFDKLHLTSLNRRINVESVSGDDIVLGTFSAPISGVFKVDKALCLTTLSGAISANITLNHPGDADQVTSSVFKTVSGNIDIKAKFEASGEREEAKFNVYAHTIRGKVDIKVDESPLDARATIDVETAAGNAVVHMPSTFEGNFNLETIVGHETVNAPDVEDPSGRGRKRELVVNHPTWKTVEGSVTWSDKGRDIGGSVRLKSVEGSLVLEL